MQESMNRDIPHKEHGITLEPHVSQQLAKWLEQVAQHRDKQAFTQLFQFFAPKVNRFGFSKLGSQASANELVQETLTSVWKKAHLFDSSKGSATTWVYTVMRNACFDMLRKMKAKPEQNLADDIWPLEKQFNDTNHEENPFPDHLLRKQMLHHVDSLPPAQKTVVKGMYYQELSQEQLAKQLGVPLGTIKSRLRLALAKLKQQMGDQYDD
ncbi:sigma-70 family RNA polymerase sigma factor [Vibrio sinus]|uniref:sigma-70 family RNA polymerase sigma factor n=1 Tax=Vibrio sinus TaxID=2946865 RepID=UPI003D6F4346